MSRLKRVAHSVASGYIVLGVTAVYALASLPLALHYLSQERFGLWSLMASISGYLSLIDFGMSGAVARLLIDHKDDRKGGAYGSLLKTGWMVLSVQGGIIFLVGLGIAPLVAHMLAIEPEFHTEFIQLMRWQSTALALTFVTRIFNHMLQAHQRIDITNYIAIGTFALNFGIQWLFFHAGQGVFSLAWATMISAFCAALVAAAVCWRLKFFPESDAWGHASLVLFKELFAFGKDMFLVAVGTQLIMASQTMIITRQMGLAASGAWFAATRTFTLVSQAIWRFSDYSGPAFSEMIVRKESALLRARYKAMVILTASVAGFGAVTFALCNSLFVTVYTTHSGNPIAWPPANDVLLGIWMIVLAVLHCHSGFVLLTKQVGFMRYVYFVEGLIFVTAGLLTAKSGGLSALIICSVVCSVFFSGAYGVWRISHYFQTSIKEVALLWIAPMGRLLLWFVPVAMVSWWGTSPIAAPTLRLAVHVLMCSSIGFYLFLRFGLPGSFQTEILQRSPKRISPFLRVIFLRPAQ
jgi:O-antigen/teichoic acid export membrane protein